MAGELLDWSHAPGDWTGGVWSPNTAADQAVSPSASACGGSPCDTTTLAIANGNHDCPESMPSGTECLLTCVEGEQPQLGEKAAAARLLPTMH